MEVKKRMKKQFSKVLKMELILGIAFSNLFSFPIPVKASNTVLGVLTANDVRLRSTPTTKEQNGVNNIILYTNMNDIVTLLSTNKVAGNGCSEGWYHVRYQSKEGYLCSKYVSLDVKTPVDPYDRPWTTPKKSIVGGAKFIASSYISKGQFTSYLKKYNVNPNGYYKVYNHQYMTNITAPSSEARTSYTTYNNNGLFNLPLAFSIPVYQNMGDGYNRPGGNLTDVEKQGNVTDQAFEEELNRQGFPESYKVALRALHAKHPNWTFTAMHTGLDFWSSVLVEKNVGAIQGGNQYYDTSSGGPVQAGNDKGWYIPNEATTAYYMDPRNFLTERYILQFESLEYSSNYTESVVQGVLTNTFMGGLSILDNEPYSSIFVAAGKEANVSAVYLASLARQESGVNGSTSTKGESFTYEGVLYSGLYNFYNIGAKSGASSPVHAGLVYASGGLCTICSPGGNTTNPGTDESVPLPLANYLVNAGYKINGSYVSGFPVEESIDNVKKKLANNDISFSSNTVGTGTTISYNGQTYTIVLYGDLTGDGKINSADLLKMRQHLQGTTTLSGAYLESAMLTQNGKVNSADLLKIRQHLLGTNKISQG